METCLTYHTRAECTSGVGGGHMKFPVGITVLGCSFLAVAALVLGAASWYWASQPVDTGFKAVQMILEHAIGIAAAAIGIGLLIHSNLSRWLAALSLVIVVSLGLAAFAWDVVTQRGTWLLIDVGLLVALVPAVVYLFVPAVERAFPHEHGRPVMRH